MSQDTLVATGPPLDVERRDKLRRRLMVLTLLAGVIVLDQAIKWWAWRHVSGAKINSGGDVLVGNVLGGWGSNLLDRLGMHYWTAPGSVRGVVDYLHLGGGTYNVADFFIIGVTPLFLVAVGYLGWGAAKRPASVRVVAPATRNRPRARTSMLALGGAGLIVVAVTLGATNYGGVSAASPHVSAKGEWHARSAGAS
jgi:lipoprotein signal peptidase